MSAGYSETYPAWMYLSIQDGTLAGTATTQVAPTYKRDEREEHLIILAVGEWRKLGQLPFIKTFFRNNRKGGYRKLTFAHVRQAQRYVWCTF